MKKKYISNCYFCGNKATSNEHVPPKLMFKGFDCDSITVPSCNKHNSSKGGSDQAIVSAFLLPLDIGQDQFPLEKEIQSAIELHYPAFERVKRNLIRMPFLADPPNIFKDLPDLAYLSSNMKFWDWIRQLSAGIVYDAVGINGMGINWSKVKPWSAEWHGSDEPISFEYSLALKLLERNRNIKSPLESLSWQNGWSAKPRAYPEVIYSFQLHFQDAHNVILRHVFYRRFMIYVPFRAIKKVIQGLIEKASAQPAAATDLAKAQRENAELRF
jgi:hypothetical protein